MAGCGSISPNLKVSDVKEPRLRSYLLKWGLSGLKIPDSRYLPPRRKGAFPWGSVYPGEVNHYKDPRTFDDRYTWRNHHQRFLETDTVVSLMPPREPLRWNERGPNGKLLSQQDLGWIYIYLSSFSITETFRFNCKKIKGDLFNIDEPLYIDVPNPQLTFLSPERKGRGTGTYKEAFRDWVLSSREPKLLLNHLHITVFNSDEEVRENSEWGSFLKEVLGAQVSLCIGS